MKWRGECPAGRLRTLERGGKSSEKPRVLKEGGRVAEKDLSENFRSWGAGEGGSSASSGPIERTNNPPRTGAKGDWATWFNRLCSLSNAQAGPEEEND